MMSSKDEKKSELPLLTEQERHQILVEFNNTKTVYPRDKCIHQLFEDQVKKNPEALAVIFPLANSIQEGEDKQITYRELNRQANKLAHYLQSKGVGPKTFVGIYMERSIEMIIGILGILKAGGAYIPLSLEYPFDRLCLMIEDAEINLVLTLQKFAHSVPNKVKLIFIDSKQNIKGPRKNPICKTKAESPAYVIYTSGSTGTPKGTIVPHRAIVRLVKNTNYIKIKPWDRIGHASNVAFDAATFEIWGALANGASIVGINRETALSSLKIADFIKKKQITVLFLTTALLNQIADQTPKAFAPLRCLLFGGEAVNPRPVRKILKAGAPKNLLHVYGPTETTTFASWYNIKSVAKEAHTIPIGKPIANTFFYVLDKDMNPVPIGVSGELYIGGDGVAIGYLNRPNLTKKRFIKNPFKKQAHQPLTPNTLTLNTLNPNTLTPNTFLYKTGDMVKWRADGNIEFLGRIDNQVKIRGFRIELGEIESVLSKHEQVKDNVVIVRETDSGHKQLIAYTVFKNRTDQKAALILRAYLKKKLPNYMIPAFFVFLDKLPLTPNGKIDRKNLPSPDISDMQKEYVGPSNRIERQLSFILKEILSIDRISIFDNIDIYGINSLNQITLLNKINKIFNLNISLVDLIETETINDISKLISSRKSAADRQVKAKNKKRLLHNHILANDSTLSIYVSNLDAGLTLRANGIISSKKRLDNDIIRKSILQVIDKHEIFSYKFNGKKFSWEKGCPVIEIRNLSLQTHDKKEIKSLEFEHFKKINSDKRYNSIDALFVIVDTGNKKSTDIIMSFNHLYIDLRSMKIIALDIQNTYYSNISGIDSSQSNISKQASFSDYLESLKYKESKFNNIQRPSNLKYRIDKNLFSKKLKSADKQISEKLYSKISDIAKKVPCSKTQLMNFIYALSFSIITELNDFEIGITLDTTEKEYRNIVFNNAYKMSIRFSINYNKDFRENFYRFRKNYYNELSIIQNHRFPMSSSNFVKYFPVFLRPLINKFIRVQPIWAIYLLVAFLYIKQTLENNLLNLITFKSNKRYLPAASEPGPLSINSDELEEEFNNKEIDFRALEIPVHKIYHEDFFSIYSETRNKKIEFKIMSKFHKKYIDKYNNILESIINTISDSDKIRSMPLGKTLEACLKMKDR